MLMENLVQKATKTIGNQQVKGTKTSFEKLIIARIVNNTKGKVKEQSLR